jgi:hypothetical protein
MKICPNCQQTYEDDGLNFCLNDGGVLETKLDDAPPPTVMMPQARQTNPNVADNYAEPQSSPWQSSPTPNSPWQTPQNPPPLNAPMVQNPPPFQPAGQSPNFISPPTSSAGSDQNLAMTALGLGAGAIVFSFCCGLISFPLALGAIITGFMGMNNANNNPQRYGGKNLAIIGMVLGGISLLISFGLILISFAL